MIIHIYNYGWGAWQGPCSHPIWSKGRKISPSFHPSLPVSFCWTGAGTVALVQQFWSFLTACNFNYTRRNFICTICNFSTKFYRSHIRCENWYIISDLDCTFFFLPKSSREQFRSGHLPLILFCSAPLLSLTRRSVRPIRGGQWDHNAIPTQQIYKNSQ